MIACEFDDLLFKGSEKIHRSELDFFQRKFLGVKAAKKDTKNELEKIERLSKFKEFKIAIKR